MLHTHLTMPSRPPFHPWEAQVIGVPQKGHGATPRRIGSGLNRTSASWSFSMPGSPMAKPLVAVAAGPPPTHTYSAPDLRFSPRAARGLRRAVGVRRLCGVGVLSERFGGGSFGTLVVFQCKCHCRNFSLTMPERKDKPPVLRPVSQPISGLLKRSKLEIPLNMHQVSPSWKNMIRCRFRHIIQPRDTTIIKDIPSRIGILGTDHGVGFRRIPSISTHGARHDAHSDGRPFGASDRSSFNARHDKRIATASFSCPRPGVHTKASMVHVNVVIKTLPRWMCMCMWFTTYEMPLPRVPPDFESQDYIQLKGKMCGANGANAQTRMWRIVRHSP